MTVKLLTEHHLEFLSLMGGCRACLSLHMSKCHIVGNHMPRLIFDFTTAGDWYCVAAVERLPALHYSVDFIFLSFGIMDFIVELKTTRGSLMKSKWQKLASLAQKICTLWFQFFGAVFASKGYPFKNIFKWLLYFK